MKRPRPIISIEMNKHERIGCAVLGVLILAACLWLFIGKESFERERFSRKICDNLVATGAVNRDQCILSDQVPEVMEATFPNGTDRIYVEQAMEGFQVIHDASGTSQTCKRWARKEYTVIDLAWDENYEFIFCDDKLIDRVWNN